MNKQMMTVAALLACLLIAATGFAADDLEKNFAVPPDSAKPRTWWHWLNGQISREGITADLESMKRVGLGGAQIFNLGGALGRPGRLRQPAVA